jgi:uncharacterized membrane protein
MTEPQKIPDAPPRTAARRRFHARVWAKLRAYFLAGVLVTAPIGITIYLGVVFLGFIDRSVSPLLPAQMPRIPGFGLIVLAVALTVIGALTAGLFGRWLVRTGERILNRMPIVRSVYGATKQIFETVLARQSMAFREAVLVEFPRREAWTIGFITARTEGEVARHMDNDLVTIYVPTTPNPTGGYMIFVPRAEVVELNMSVEDAWKMIISVGIVTPPDRPARLPRAEQADSSVALEKVEKRA